MNLYDLIEEYLLLFLTLSPLITQLGIPLGFTFFMMLQGSLTTTYSSYIIISLLIAISLVFGDLIAYGIGYKYGEKLLNKTQKYKSLHKSLKIVEKKIENNLTLTLLLSRSFLIGIIFITNYSFGIQKISIKKLLPQLLIFEFMYVLIFLGIGFFFKDTWSYLFTYITEVGEIVLLLIILYIIIKSLFKKNIFFQKI